MAFAALCAGRIAWIERPPMIGNQEPMYLAAYFHHPGLYVFCLHAVACEAVDRPPIVGLNH